MSNPKPPTFTVTIPIQITVSVGAPIAGAAAATATATTRPDKARTVEAFLRTGAWNVVEATNEESVTPIDEVFVAKVRAWRAELAVEAPAGAVPTILDDLREFYHRPDMTAEEADRLLSVMERITADPASFFDAMEAAQRGEVPAEEGVMDWLKIPFRFPTRAISKEDIPRVAKLQKDYGLPADVPINPNEHHFETEDPNWISLWKAGAREWLKLWPKGLDTFRTHVDRKNVFEGKPGTTKVALFADWGIGHYHTEMIARTIAKQNYPYVFHLGDVYYGGAQAEFDNNYTRPLQRVMTKDTLLFSIPENHELYGKGTAYLKFLDDQRKAGRIVQETSYFCVRFPKHQFVAIDVNWQARQRFLPGNDGPNGQRAWLREQLAIGVEKKLTTILLTGSAPYVYGKSEATLLASDLKGFFHDFQMWFWGDNHYCALYPYDRDKAPFVGSCIGWGGFPERKPERGKSTYVNPLWLETEPRFPKGTGLRDDLANNGWVELTLGSEGEVGLVYVDWLGKRRTTASYRVAHGANGQVLELVAPPQDLGRTQPL